MNKILIEKSKKKGWDKKNLSLKQWEIFDLPLFGGSKQEVLKIIADFLASGEKRKWIATVNPEFVMEATKDRHFYEILQKTDLNVVDGVGLVWADQFIKFVKSKFYQVNFLEKLVFGFKTGLEVLRGEYRDQISSGSDLIDDLCRLASEKKYKVFFLGGFEDRAKRTEQYFKNKYKGLKTENCEGRPKVENKEVVERINKFKPDILFVAYAMKKQEIWIGENLKDLNVGIVMGVGRSFDYYSGSLKRAPMMWRKMGLEWLYSLIKEPKRWKRQLALPRFVWKVLKNDL